jgi:hypothetical protein
MLLLRLFKPEAAAKEEWMNSERKGAIITGLLFIFATAVGFVGNGILGSSLRAPDYLAVLSVDRSRVILSAIFKISGAAASAGIAMSLYPVLRKYSVALALGSVCFRLVEGVFYLVGDLGLLSLVPLSQEYAKAGAELAPQFRILGAVIQEAGGWSGFVLAVFAFCIGASMYYWMFFRTRLVPRWLSLWGLIALGMLMTMVLLGMFEGKPTPSGIKLALALPIAAQEMVLALWLIARGFDPAADRPR